MGGERMENIGTGIGKRKCFVCVMDGAGRVLEETSYDNTMRQAQQFAERTGRRYGTCRAVCESAGNMRIRTYETLKGCGMPVQLANPPGTGAIAEARTRTDRIDARTLAYLLRGDPMASCHVPAPGTRSQKEVLRHRTRLVQDRTRAANRMHALPGRYDIAVIGNHITGVRNLDRLSTTSLPLADDNEILHQCVRHVRHLNSETKELDGTTGRLAYGNADARRMVSMTGSGSFGALLIAPGIGGPGGFATPARLVSWMGLCPTVHRSGNTMHHGRVKKDSNRKVSRMMTQAANVAAFRDDRTGRAYENARKRHPHGIAVSPALQTLSKFTLACRKRHHHGIAVSHAADRTATVIWPMLHNGINLPLRPEIYIDASIFPGLWPGSAPARAWPGYISLS